MPTPAPTPLHLLVLGGLLLTIAAPAGAWDLCRHAAERRASHDTAGATRVVIEARAGELDVRPARGTTLEAHGRACASRESWLAQTDVRVRRDGDMVRVEVLMPENMSGLGLVYATLDLTVEVPAALPVEITDSSGDLEVRDLRLERLTDSSGDIEVLRPLGDLELDDSSGDLRVEQAAGRVLVRDSSGDIVIRGAREVSIPSDSSGDITVERVSGNVLIEQDSSGDIRVEDVDGDFTLERDSSGSVRTNDVRGNVRTP